MSNDSMNHKHVTDQLLDMTATGRSIARVGAGVGYLKRDFFGVISWDASVVTGAGTANTIPMWSGTTTLTNSIMFYVPNYIGIGGTKPDSGTIGYTKIGGGRTWQDQEFVNEYIQFGISNDPPDWAEGCTYWDSTDKCLAFHTEKVGTSIQIGQEIVCKVVNKTGSPLLDGTVVYNSGSQGNRPTATEAYAVNGHGPDRGIGVVTNDITNNLEGYVTTFGIVRGYNTSSFAAGDLLYLHPTTPGALTNVPPMPPYRRIKIGTALNSTNNGSILVSIHPEMDMMRVHMSHGFENRTDSTVSFAALTRTVTVAPVSTSFSYYHSGTLITKTTAQTVSFADTAGAWFIYFNASDVLTASQTPWDIDSENTPVAVIYWNKTAGRVQEERHGYGRNRPWHKWAHLTIGTRYESGLVGTFTNTTLAFTEGYIDDEDIRFYIGAQSNCVVWYYSATLSAMTFAEVTTPYQTTGGTLAYDNAGTLTAVSSGRYVVNDVYASLDTGRPIYIRIGTAQHTTLAAARAAAQASWNNIVSAELKLLYRVIYQNTGGTTTFVESSDFRSSGSVPQGGTPSIAPHASTHRYDGVDPIFNAPVKYYTNAGQSIPSTAYTIVDFGSVSFDTQSLVTTGASWHFTAPADGMYLVSLSIIFDSTSWLAGTTLYAFAYVDGSPAETIYRNSNENSGSYKAFAGMALVNMTSGQQMDIRLYHNSTSLNLYNAQAHNNIKITRVA